MAGGRAWPSWAAACGAVLSGDHLAACHGPVGGPRAGKTAGLRRLEKTERGQGRIEWRAYSAMPAPRSLRDTGDWDVLRTIADEIARLL